MFMQQNPILTFLLFIKTNSDFVTLQFKANGSIKKAKGIRSPYIFSDSVGRMRVSNSYPGPHTFLSFSYENLVVVLHEEEFVSCPRTNSDHQQKLCRLGEGTIYIYAYFSCSSMPLSVTDFVSYFIARFFSMKLT
jgi:hypothetical protein